MKIERELIRNYWHPLCFLGEIPENGSFVRFEILDKEVIIFNDFGSIIAFENICPHRGAKLISGDFGIEKIRCLYHGWSYSRGSLRIPHRETFNHCEVEGLGLRFLELSFCGDFVFLGFSPVTNLKEQLGNYLFDFIERISKFLRRRVDFNRYDFECAWPIAIENALEPYHIPMVHSKTLAKLKLGRGSEDYFGLNSIWRSSVGDPVLAKRLSSLCRFFLDSESYPGYFNLYIFPFSMISSTYGFSYSFQNFFPAKSGLTKFTSRLYSSAESNNRYASLVLDFASSSANLNREVFREDHEVCKSISTEFWNYADFKNLSTLEARILHFRRSLAMAIN